MVLPAPPSSPILDERHRTALRTCVTSILEDLVAGVASADFVSAAMDAVFSVVQSSCADFATQWNDLNTRTITTRLPVEVLTSCLGPADFNTRVRASQVSRAWRSALISDRQLWNDIYCPITGRPEPAFRRLEALLQRSSPLPFRLRIPHTHYTDYSDCRNHITALVAPHIHRLQGYDGPVNVFVDLDPSRQPLPALTSLDCRHESDRDAYIFHRPELSAVRLLNLLRLVTPILKQVDTPPYECLRHLVCGLGTGDDCGDLVRCCPNVVTVEFIAAEQPMQLPRGPLPSSIERLTIRAARLPGRWSDETDEDFACLQDWTAERIPRLVLHGANSLSPISHAFVSSHGSALRLDLADDLRITSAPDARYMWEVHTCDFLWKRRGRESEMHTMLVATGAPSICVTNALIGPFFAARAHLSHLVSLTFDLRYFPDDILPPDADGSHYVEAPNLQHVCLEIYGYEWTLGVLQSNFREMIVYDADLLETLTVDYLGCEVTEDSDCAELARFAKRYIEVR